LKIDLSSGFRRESMIHDIKSRHQRTDPESILTTSEIVSAV
jgi:hypothetical protein